MRRGLVFAPLLGLVKILVTKFNLPATHGESDNFPCDSFKKRTSHKNKVFRLVIRFVYLLVSGKSKRQVISGSSRDHVSPVG